MRRIASLLLLLVIAVLCLSQSKKGTTGGSTHRRSGGSGTTASSSTNFTLECASLPFDSIATKPDPFVQCDNCGVVSPSNPDPVAAGVFSHAKNDFCADFSQPTLVTFDTLRKMQDQANAQGLTKRDLPDRSKLHNFFKVGSKNIGEGDAVRLVAWIRQAHISDCRTGETVNCNIPGFASNDIHIVLMDPGSGGPGQDECSSATAEMSPHFRPATWSNLDLKTPNQNVVRFTGPLFFDNAHEPCAAPFTSTGKNAGLNPKRSSVWEVHPVYQFEVCANTNPKQCDPNSSDASLWVPYDKWVAQTGSSTIPTGQTLRSECKSAPQKAGVVVPQCPLNPH
jgi:hypothetical protein